MDHFEAPVWPGADKNPIRVPYKCNSEYDGGTFFTYPARHGWTEEELARLECGGGNSKPGHAEAFLQTWLYFGTLWCIFDVVGISVTAADFTRVVEGDETVVTTFALPRLIQQWQKFDNFEQRWEEYKSKHDSPSNRGLDSKEKYRRMGALYERGKTIKAILCRLNELSYRYCNDRTQASLAASATCSPSVLSHEVSMSILALGWTLADAFGRIYLDTLSLDWPHATHLKNHMQKLNWCPTEIASFFSRHYINAHYFFAQLPSPRWERDHSRCTEKYCDGRRLDNVRYRTKHSKAGCKCAFVEAPKEVLSIIKSGGTPLLSWRKAKDGKYQLKAIKYEKGSGMNYVAISHVWSDGLGNETSNSLPTCALDFLKACVDQLYVRRRRENKHQNAIGPLILRPKPQNPQGDEPLPTVAGFWMDTLCVPVREEDYEWRKVSIRRMREIYSEAHRVMVLDAGVRKLRGKKDSINTKGTVIALSNWQRRLWTLQEGVLAQNLFFMFRDALQSVEEMIKMEDKNKVESYQRFGSRLLMTVPMLDLMTGSIKQDQDDDMVTRFPVILPPLESRTTTRKSDETICLATLLDFDPAPLLDIRSNRFKIKENPAPAITEPGIKETETVEKERKKLAEAWVCTERMAAFFHILKSLPSIIPFNTYPRITKLGYRWAPRSFLDLQNDSRGTLHPNGIQGVGHQSVAGVRIASETEGGLLVKFPGVIFHLEAQDWRFLPALSPLPQKQQQQEHQPNSADDTFKSPLAVKAATAALFIRASHDKELGISVHPCAGEVMPDLSSHPEHSSNHKGNGYYFAIMSHGPINTAYGKGYGAAILGRLVDFDPDPDSVPPNSLATRIRLEHLCRVDIQINPVLVPRLSRGSDTKSDSVPALSLSGIIGREGETAHGDRHRHLEIDEKEAVNIQIVEDLVLKVEGKWVDRTQSWCVL